MKLDGRTKHGDFGTRLYQIWADMKRRCINPKCHAYKDYGGRGIAVCNEWMEYIPFKEWALKSGYSDNLEIDREDNDGNYTPDNCKWSTRKEQQGNRRSCVHIEIDGVTKTLTEWSECSGVSIRAIWSRYNNPNCPHSELLRPSHRGLKLNGGA